MVAHLWGRGSAARFARAAGCVRSRSPRMPLPPALLDALPLLACPRCGGALVSRDARDARDAGVECVACAASWPLVDGVLDFLAHPCEDAAEPEEPRDR